MGFLPAFAASSTKRGADGFIEMAQHQAPAAIQAMSGTEVAGRRLKVRLAR